MPVHMWPPYPIPDAALQGRQHQDGWISFHASYGKPCTFSREGILQWPSFGSEPRQLLPVRVGNTELDGLIAWLSRKRTS